MKLKRKEYLVRSVTFVAELIVKEAELSAGQSDYILKEKTQWLLEVPFCPIRKLEIRNDCVN